MAKAEMTSQSCRFTVLSASSCRRLFSSASLRPSEAPACVLGKSSEDRALTVPLLTPVRCYAALIKRFFKSAKIDELDDLSNAAEERVQRLGDKLRANIIPPLLRELRTFTAADFKADLRSGVVIAALTIPQAVAFSLLIGIPVPAVIGSALVGAVLCSLYCSSKHLVFGPTNTISIILTGALLSLSAEPLDPLQKVLIIGFLMGALQLAAGFADFGKVTHGLFPARSSSGYSTAVGLLIATGQLGEICSALLEGARSAFPAPCATWPIAS